MEHSTIFQWLVGNSKILEIERNPRLSDKPIAFYMNKYIQNKREKLERYFKEKKKEEEKNQNKKGPYARLPNLLYPAELYT